MDTLLLQRFGLAGAGEPSMSISRSCLSALIEFTKRVGWHPPAGLQPLHMTIDRPRVTAKQARALGQALAIARHTEPEHPLVGTEELKAIIEFARGGSFVITTTHEVFCSSGREDHE